MKLVLGMEVGLSPGHIVRDGDPAPLPPKGGRTPLIFGPCLLWPNVWMDQDATWYGGRPRPSDVVLDGNPAPLGKGAQQPAPSFRRMSIVATVAHLSYCWALVEFSYKLDHPLHGIMLTHCPSLLPPRHTHIPWTSTS